MSVREGARSRFHRYRWRYAAVFTGGGALALAAWAFVDALDRSWPDNKAVEIGTEIANRLDHNRYLNYEFRVDLSEPEFSGCLPFPFRKLVKPCQAISIWTEDTHSSQSVAGLQADTKYIQELTQEIASKHSIESNIWIKLVQLRKMGEQGGWSHFDRQDLIHFKLDGNNNASSGN